MRVFMPLGICGSLVAAPLTAQEAPAPAMAETSVQPASEAAAAMRIPALTPVRIEILETMNSSVSKIGAHFAIRLASPVDLPGGGVIPAGITGSGDVVHAAKSRFGGKPGELILAVRYLDYEGVRIPLRSLTYLPMRAKDNTDVAGAVGIAAGPLSFFITGGEVIIPAGTVASAKTSAAVALPAPAKETIGISAEIGDQSL